VPGDRLQIRECSWYRRDGAGGWLKNSTNHVGQLDLKERRLRFSYQLVE